MILPPTGGKQPVNAQAKAVCNELQQAKAILRTTRHHCGSAVSIGYQPGLTAIYCHQCAKVVAQAPDWQPVTLANDFAKRHPHDARPHT